MNVVHSLNGQSTRSETSTALRFSAATRFTHYKTGQLAKCSILPAQHNQQKRPHSSVFQQEQVCCPEKNSVLRILSARKGDLLGWWWIHSPSLKGICATSPPPPFSQLLYFLQWRQHYTSHVRQGVATSHSLLVYVYLIYTPLHLCFSHGGIVFRNISPQFFYLQYFPTSSRLGLMLFSHVGSVTEIQTTGGGV